MPPYPFLKNITYRFYKKVLEFYTNKIKKSFLSVYFRNSFSKKRREIV
jgi:hypothetical protein